MSINQLSTPKINSITDQNNYTPRMQYPMALMYGQPNNTQNITFHLESVDAIAGFWTDLIKERITTLSGVASETLDGIKAMFRISPNVTYGITQIPYATVAKVQLENVIGLKCSIKDYSLILDEALTIALNVLEFELPAVTRLVATLLTDKKALDSLTPIPALGDIKMHSQDTRVVKDKLAAVIGEHKTKPYVTFGEAYYSNNEYREVSKRIQDMSIKIRKKDIKRFAKDVNNLTALMDKLIMRTANRPIPSDNIQLYSSVIEECSNNVAFAGAVINLCDTLTYVAEGHSKVLEVEIEDFKKHNKK